MVHVAAKAFWLRYVAQYGDIGQYHEHRQIIGIFLNESVSSRTNYRSYDVRHLRCCFLGRVLLMNHFKDEIWVYVRKNRSSSAFNCHWLANKAAKVDDSGEMRGLRGSLEKWKGVSWYWITLLWRSNLRCCVCGSGLIGKIPPRSSQSLKEELQYLSSVWKSS